ncbi:hypothetical protein BLNAU_21752 [Blattamonas nauphoetae]|uniref:Uncharacterized protein n=1 Tax=Blattamonas nauphoetae TaxID=2049346 RepID=A0ABQ9WV17_9EUKA|nr:hypothetical protein BLNAU_21752 [Blattamonas nauphoetae]
MTALDTKRSCSTDSPSSDCFPFLNWKYHFQESDEEKAVVFRSLVATVQSQHALDVSLEEKAVEFLESVDLYHEESGDDFLHSFASNSDESLKIFVQSIMVLISTANQAITTAAMKKLISLIGDCSTEVRLALVKADLIPQIINILNPQSLSYAETVDIHVYLMATIAWCFSLASPIGLKELEIEDDNEQPAVYEAVLQQVLAPSEKYICHLCMNRLSIADGDRSIQLLSMLAHLLRISPFYQPTMNTVLDMPVIVAIPSYLTFVKHDRSFEHFLYLMNKAQEKWYNTRDGVRQRWNSVHRRLRMEGIEDVIEERLRNDHNGRGSWIVADSIRWNNMHGMNIAEQN